MKLELSTSYAVDLLLRDEHAGWSYKGATALVEYMEDMEEDLGEEINFNVVDFRSDFSEYKSLRDWLTSYFGRPLKEALKSAGIDHEETDLDAEDKTWLGGPPGGYLISLDVLIADYIRARGTLIEFDGGIIVSSDF